MVNFGAMTEHAQYMVVKLLSPEANPEVVPFKMIRPDDEIMLFGPGTKHACEEFLKTGK